jgi:hypothetical protein
MVLPAAHLPRNPTRLAETGHDTHPPSACEGRGPGVDGEKASLAGEDVLGEDPVHLRVVRFEQAGQ